MLMNRLLNTVSSIYSLSQMLREPEITDENKTRGRSSIHALSRQLEPQDVARLATAYGHLWYGLQQMEKSWEINRAVIKRAMRDVEAECRQDEVAPLQARLTVLATLLQQLRNIQALGRLSEASPRTPQ